MQLIGVKDANRLKEVLVEARITQPQLVTCPDIGITIRYDGVSTAQEGRFPDMMERFLTVSGGTNVLEAKQKSHEVFVNVGEWGNGKQRLDAHHVCLGCALFGSYFAQVELSQALDDGFFVHIVKNVTSLGGYGAITRLNNGALDTAQKRLRRQQLVDQFDGKSLIHDGNEWLIITSLSKKQLHSPRYANSLLQQFMSDFLRYTLTVEKVVADKPEAELTGGMVGGRYYTKLTHEQKRSIELAAMDAAVRFYTSKGATVEDVSNQRGLGYDLVASWPSNGRGRLCVEVKGTTLSSNWSVTLTRNEHDAALHLGNGYILLMVFLDDVYKLNVTAIEELRDPLRDSSLEVSPNQYAVSPRRSSC